MAHSCSDFQWFPFSDAKSKSLLCSASKALQDLTPSLVSLTSYRALPCSLSSSHIVPCCSSDKLLPQGLCTSPLCLHTFTGSLFIAFRSFPKVIISKGFSLVTLLQMSTPSLTFPLSALYSA